MLEIGWFSAKLFLKGKLLRDPMYFLQKTAIAVTISLIILVSLAQVEVPFYLPVTISSLVAGAIMPFLLKDFKMK